MLDGLFCATPVRIGASAASVAPRRFPCGDVSGKSALICATSWLLVGATRFGLIGCVGSGDDELSLHAVATTVAASRMAIGSGRRIRASSWVGHGPRKGLEHATPCGVRTGEHCVWSGRGPPRPYHLPGDYLPVPTSAW